MTFWKRILNDDSGQDLVEYGLLAALISIVAVTSLQAIGPLVAAALRIHDTVRRAAG